MARRRGNPNFGKPEIGPLPPASATSFEMVVKSMSLSPAEYQHSAELREWVRRNKDSKYVPSDVLKLWGFTVDTEKGLSSLIP
jgi:hypothetical protein